MKPEFKRLMQIGIIVRDIDEAVKKYEAMGMGPWDITVMRNDQPPFEDLTFNGEAISEKGPVMKTAMMTCFGLEFELIEPIADTVYKSWLDEQYETLLEDTKKETDKEPWVRGQGIHGLMDFSYLDLRDELGLIVECYSTLQPGKPALPYDMKGEVAE